VIAAFEPHDYVVAPSGSCAGMIRKHYPALFSDDPEWGPRAKALGSRTYELVSFLTDILGVNLVEARFDGAITYHDSCSGLRELGIRHQPRKLLAGVEGLELRELPDADVCCGFGGTFCVKYPDISNAIVESKTASIAATGAGTLLAGDLGCADEHGRQAEARRPGNRKPPRGRGAGRNGGWPGNRGGLE
jgi:L-lactate dehydrogenase complex protein LldE